MCDACLSRPANYLRPARACGKHRRPDLKHIRTNNRNPLFARPETEALLRQFPITPNDSHDRCKSDPSFQENTCDVHKLHDDDDAKKTEPAKHDADLETRWWYDDERQQFSASREAHDVHRHCLLSSLTLTSPPSQYDSRPRSVFRLQSQLTRASRDMIHVKREQRQHIEFLSSATAEEHPPQWCSTVDTAGDVEPALHLNRDIEGCWRSVVLRALLARSAVRLQLTFCELVVIEHNDEMRS